MFTVSNLRRIYINIQVIQIQSENLNLLLQVVELF